MLQHNLCKLTKMIVNQVAMKRQGKLIANFKLFLGVKQKSFWKE